jgi:hypothetical protein
LRRSLSAVPDASRVPPAAMRKVPFCSRPPVQARRLLTTTGTSRTTTPPPITISSLPSGTPAGVHAPGFDHAAVPWFQVFCAGHPVTNAQGSSPARVIRICGLIAIVAQQVG